MHEITGYLKKQVFHIDPGVTTSVLVGFLKASNAVVSLHEAPCCLLLAAFAYIMHSCTNTALPPLSEQLGD